MAINRNAWTTPSGKANQQTTLNLTPTAATEPWKRIQQGNQYAQQVNLRHNKTSHMLLIKIASGTQEVVWPWKPISTFAKHHGKSLRQPIDFLIFITLRKSSECKGVEFARRANQLYDWAEIIMRRAITSVENWINLAGGADRYSNTLTIYEANWRSSITT